MLPELGSLRQFLHTWHRDVPWAQFWLRAQLHGNIRTDTSLCQSYWHGTLSTALELKNMRGEFPPFPCCSCVFTRSHSEYWAGVALNHISVCEGVPCAIKEIGKGSVKQMAVQEKGKHQLMLESLGKGNSTDQRLQRKGTLPTQMDFMLFKVKSVYWSKLDLSTDMVMPSSLQKMRSCVWVRYD